MLASSTAKLVAACVCPVVGAGALTVASPKVRSAVHDMTAPKRVAKAKPRVRVPTRPALAKAGAGIICPQPTMLNGGRELPTDFDALAAMLGAARQGTSGSGTIGSASNRGGGNDFARIGGSSGGGGGAGPALLEPQPEGERRPDEEMPGDGLPPGSGTTPIAVVPEPGTWLQMLLGFGVLGGLLRLRYRRHPAWPSMRRTD